MQEAIILDTKIYTYSPTGHATTKGIRWVKTIIHTHAHAEMTIKVAAQGRRGGNSS